MNTAKQRVVSRNKRVSRIRKKINGTAERPRLCVKRTLKHFWSQIIDDISGTTLVAASSLDKEISENKKRNKTDISKSVGELVASRALEKGITKVVFDRKGYPYHGRVKAFAESARNKGLQF